jgi:protein tyrosine phosphatase (PTP) superfamily phosphohydrolase (DUF442 family)
MRTHPRLIAAAILAGGLVAAPTVGGAWLAPQSPAAAAPAAAPAPAPDPGSLLPNGRQPLPGVLTGGQPTDEQLDALAAAGYKTLVTLRVPAEAPPPLADRARGLGLRYVELPVAGAQDLTAEKVAELGKLLGDRTAYPLAIHCASGNRVGALLALEQVQVEGKDAKEALAIGLDAGLTHLEPKVRELLSLPPD